ncbi:tyrosine-type recombinase/integrase [Verrucomicrobiota bacterium]
MAKTFKREGSPYYWIKTQIRGKVYRLSTKQKTKAGAETEADRILIKIRDEAKCDDLFDQLAAKLENIEDKKEQDKICQSYITRLLRSQNTKVSIEDTWPAWLDSPKKRNPGERTLQGYCGQWSKFTEWLSKHHKTIEYLHEITPGIAEEYATWLWKSNITPSTYNAHTKTLKLICRVLKVQAGIADNPWDEIPLMENEKESKRNLTTKELQKVCSTATGNLRYWLAIGLYTGLRLGDVVTLLWDEVKFDEGVIERVPMKTRRKNKVVRFPLHPVLHAMLLELREATKSKKYLFPEEAEQYKRDQSGVAQITQRHFVACGIKTSEKPKNGHRRRPIVRVGFHSLRHSFVSLCAAHRVPEVAIMEMVGHGSPAMTKLYSHAGDEQKAKAIAALPEYVFGQDEK